MDLVTREVEDNLSGERKDKEDAVENYDYKGFQL